MISGTGKVAHALICALVRGDLRAGDRIDVAQLCTQHRVSRTVIREALAQLAGRGMVIADPGVGTTVADEALWHRLDPELVQAALDFDPLRAAIEASALRHAIEPALAAEAARSADRSQRLAVLGALRAVADALSTEDLERIVAADLGLHTAIAAACPNRLLQAADRPLEPVRDSSYRRLRAALASPPAHLPTVEAPVASTRTPRVIELQRALALAIVRADPVQARAAATSLVEASSPDPVPHPAWVARAASTQAQPTEEAVDPAPQDWPDTVILDIPSLTTPRSSDRPTERSTALPRP